MLKGVRERTIELTENLLFVGVVDCRGGKKAALNNWRTRTHPSSYLWQKAGGLHSSSQTKRNGSTRRSSLSEGQAGPQAWQGPAGQRPSGQGLAQWPPDAPTPQPRPHTASWSPKWCPLGCLILAIRSQIRQRVTCMMCYAADH